MNNNDLKPKAKRQQALNKAGVKRRFALPIRQYYDGNFYSQRRYAAGHLFEDGSNISLCGREMSLMSAPVLEAVYDKLNDVPEAGTIGKHCSKCSNVVRQNVA